MNEITLDGRTYRVGDKDTPIVKWSIGIEFVYVLKPEGLFLVDTNNRSIYKVFNLMDEERAKMVPQRLMAGST